MAEFDEYPDETKQELGKLMLKMSRNKQLRRPLLKMVQSIDQNYTLPGDQQVEDLRQELAHEREKNRISAASNEVKAKLEQQRAGLLSGSLLGRKYDDAQVADIEKVMTKYGIGDYEAGAKIYQTEARPERPTNKPGSPSWTFPDLPGLMDDPARAARDAAYGVIDELRGGR